MHQNLQAKLLSKSGERRTVSGMDENKLKVQETDQYESLQNNSQ